MSPTTARGAASKIRGMTPIIETHELTKRFGDRVAVDDVSLEVPRGR